jgi:hypothetical protein
MWRNAASQRGVITVGAAATPAPEAEAEEDDGIKLLSERLIVELTAHRTLDALANDPGAAFTAVLHALRLGAFYHTPSGRCLEITARSISFGTQAPGLAGSASAKAIEARHQQWAKQLPKAEGDLWNALVAFDGDSQAALQQNTAHGCNSKGFDAPESPGRPIRLLVRRGRSGRGRRSRRSGRGRVGRRLKGTRPPWVWRWRRAASSPCATRPPHPPKRWPCGRCWAPVAALPPWVAR